MELPKQSEEIANLIYESATRVDKTTESPVFRRRAYKLIEAAQMEFAGMPSETRKAIIESLKDSDALFDRIGVPSASEPQTIEKLSVSLPEILCFLARRAQPVTHCQKL